MTTPTRVPHKKPAGNTESAPTARPLRPRRKLFVILLVVFAAWLSAMLMLYVTTVYPQRYPSTSAPEDVK